MYILDRATYWLQSYADARKMAEVTICALQKFYGPDISQACKHIYSGSSGEIEEACKHFMFSHDTSTPHVPQTNGIAENVVERDKEGTACTLSQSGLGEAWWKEAMGRFCFSKNFVDILWTNKAAYAMRFAQSYSGLIIPFGAEVHYFPASQSDTAGLHEMSDGLWGYSQDTNSRPEAGGQKLSVSSIGMR